MRRTMCTHGTLGAKGVSPVCSPWEAGEWRGPRAKAPVAFLRSVERIPQELEQGVGRRARQGIVGRLRGTSNGYVQAG